jgi:hypothetical protein
MKLCYLRSVLIFLMSLRLFMPKYHYILIFTDKNLLLVQMFTWTTVPEHFKAMISIRFAQGYKRRPDQTRNEWVNYPRGNWTSFRESPIVSCHKWYELTVTVGRAIAKAVSRRLPTAAARVHTRVWSCGILWWTKLALGQFSPRTSVSPANLHSICFSTIIFTITRGWHNSPGVAAMPIASQTK